MVVTATTTMATARATCECGCDRMGSSNSSCFAELLHACIEILTRKRGQAVQAERFDGKARGDRAPCQRGLHGAEVGRAGGCEVAHHSARKAVACPGGIDDMLELRGIRRHHGDAIT